ncbi:hypothetical protein NBRC116592_26210 [Colwellia sp. KU-HH00111]|uniref:hypothetical protein n=1 Tax=Colwellia sp. KU-HH00111 TaxID=3127652 RepID=UPI0031093D33
MNKTMAVILVLLLACSTQSQAQSVLTKELITSFQQVSQQWQALEHQYPDLTSLSDDFDMSQPNKIIAQLKNSKAYPKIKSILASANFSDIEQYYNIATRIMGGMMAHQMQQMPSGMNIDSMTQRLKQSIEQMKANNAPNTMISEMQAQLDDMEKNMKNMKSAMKNTTDADREFISENAQWIMSMLDDEQ